MKFEKPIAHAKKMRLNTFKSDAPFLVLLKIFCHIYDFSDTTLNFKNTHTHPRAFFVTLSDIHGGTFCQNSYQILDVNYP